MRLKDLREDADLRQKDIAEYLHIKQNTYSQYENNQRQLPIDVLIKLSKFYKVSTDYILELTDEKWLHKRQKQMQNANEPIPKSQTKNPTFKIGS